MELTPELMAQIKAGVMTPELRAAFKAHAEQAVKIKPTMTPEQAAQWKIRPDRIPTSAEMEAAERAEQRSTRAPE